MVQVPPSSQLSSSLNGMAPELDAVLVAVALLIQFLALNRALLALELAGTSNHLTFPLYLTSLTRSSLWAASLRHCLARWPMEPQTAHTLDPSRNRVPALGVFAAALVCAYGQDAPLGHFLPSLSSLHWIWILFLPPLPWAEAGGFGAAAGLMAVAISFFCLDLERCRSGVLESPSFQWINGQALPRLQLWR